MAAAEFAVKERGKKQEMTYKLVSVEHAEDDDVDTTEFVRAVVYRNLQKEYSLTSWAQENCGEDEGETVQNRQVRNRWVRNPDESR